MSTAIYTFREGSRFQKGASAIPHAAGERLEALRQQAEGELTSSAVVNDARSQGSPLHSFFEWDDTEAAEQYRLHQARNLIRSVVVTYGNDLVASARSVVAFVNIKTADTQFYTSTAAAMSDREQRAIVLRQAWQDLQAFRRRYGELTEFAALFMTMDEMAAVLLTTAASGQHPETHH
jgi:Holliday junction resolvase-like predicted endonuclease